MLGTTHGSAGLFLGALSGAACGGGTSGLIWGAAAGCVAGLLPDVDHPGSMAGRLLRPVSLYLEERWGHRDSPTHTASFVLLAALPLAVLWLLFGCLAAPFLGALFGGASHIALDATTKSGVRPWRYIWFIPQKWRERLCRGKLETGSSLEWLLTAGFLAGTILLAMYITRRI